MPGLPSHTVKQLSSVDLVAVIEQFCELSRKGKEYKGLCPFPEHNDTNPSFSVNPDKNLFYCMGCKKGGGPIQFYQYLFGISFVDAARMLGDQHGISVTGSQDNDQLYQVLELATGVYQEMLIDEKKISDYLSARGLTNDTIQKFRIGFAPSEMGQDAMTRVLSVEFPIELLIQAGLSIRLDDGRIVDYFRDRVVWPICDINNRVIAIAGRVGPWSVSLPKYINSPDSPIFQKGRVLFNAHNAMEPARDRGEVILFEDYFSVFVADQSGIANTISGMGTAIDSYRAKVAHGLSRGRVIICYDPDMAGMVGAMKMSTVMLASNVESVIVTIPTEDDPDEFILKYGVAEFSKHLREAIPPVQYIGEYIGSKFDLDTAEGQMKAAESLSDVIKLMDTGLQQVLISETLKSQTGLKVDIKKSKKVASEFKLNKKLELPQVEVEFFSCILQHPELHSNFDEIETRGLSEVGKVLLDTYNGGVEFEELSPDLQQLVGFLASVDVKGDPKLKVMEAVVIINARALDKFRNEILEAIQVVDEGTQITLTKEYLELFGGSKP